MKRKPAKRIIGEANTKLFAQSVVAKVQIFWFRPYLSINMRTGLRPISSGSVWFVSFARQEFFPVFQGFCLPARRVAAGLPNRLRLAAQFGGFLRL